MCLISADWRAKIPVGEPDLDRRWTQGILGFESVKLGEPKSRLAIRRPGKRSRSCPSFGPAKLGEVSAHSAYHRVGRRAKLMSPTARVLDGENQVGEREEQSVDHRMVPRYSVRSPKGTELKDAEGQSKKAMELTKGRITDLFGKPDLLRRMVLRSIFWRL
uniref:Uncharacterized protein n=1 Tax=Solanum tuberosum TaxID=4113 RepID=M1DWY9_SOLTU